MTSKSRRRHTDQRLDDQVQIFVSIFSDRGVKQLENKNLLDVQTSISRPSTPTPVVDVSILCCPNPAFDIQIHLLHVQNRFVHPDAGWNVQDKTSTSKSGWPWPILRICVRKSRQDQKYERGGALNLRASWDVSRVPQMWLVLFLVERWSLEGLLRWKYTNPNRSPVRH